MSPDAALHCIDGMHLVLFTPALSKVIGCEVMIFPPSIERDGIKIDAGSGVGYVRLLAS